MATIRSQMTLNDGMSAVLKKITNALGTTLHSFEMVQQASGQAIDVGMIQSAQVQLGAANRTIKEMEEYYRRAAEQEENLNQGIRNGTVAADGMLGKVKGLAASLAAGFGVQKIFDLSDQMTSTTARLNLMVDDGGSVTDLEQKIMASAQRSRAAYLDTASAIATMGANAGNAFSGNDELIAFMEQVNKQFVIGGATAEGQSAAMLQLTQAMAAGALRGEELNSILENAPGIARAIESYMGVAEGSIKQYAQEGLVTAEVVKNAIFSVAEETNAKFESMPMTWGQVWTQMGNIALQVLDPVLDGVNWLANNIEIIGPIVLGVAGAFLVYAAATHGAEIATKLWTAAQAAFNGVMALNPVFLIIMGVMLLIAAIYAIVAAVNNATGATTSATGLIAGAFFVMGAHILNSTVIPLQNGFASFVNFLGNVFNNPLAAIQVAFLDMCLTVMGYITNLAHGIENLLNKIPGVTVDITSGLDSFYAGLEQAQQAVKGESGWVEYVKKLDYIDYGDAANAGYQFGQGIDDKIGGMLNLGSAGDYGGGFALDDIAADTGSIADSAGSAADALSISNEQLEYLRDLADREAVNRFTTAEVRVEQTISNNISNSADLDGVISTLTDGFAEALMTAAEGVHA